MTDRRAAANFVPSAKALAPSSVRIEAAFSCLSFSAIYLQKISIPGLDVGLDLIILWGVLLWFAIRGAAYIQRLRLVLYIATTCTVMIGLILEQSIFVEQSIFSIPALGLFLFANGAVLLFAEVDQAVTLRCYKSFQTMMVPIAYIIIGQQVIQYTVGNAYWPNLNNFIPHAFLIQGFVYLRPLAWQSPYLVPNGVFFLEPSAASWFIAISAVIEIIWLKRFKHLCLFGFVLPISMAGTGITLIALLSPALLRKMDRRLRRLTLKIGIPIVLIAGATGAIPHLAQRSEEFSDPQSSAYGRMDVPFEATVELFTNPSYLMSGNGPGSTPKTGNVVSWPSNKVAYEYGTLTAVVFLMFLLVSVLGQATSRVLALAGLLPTLIFGGGFLSAPATMMMVMFGSLLRLRDSNDGSVEPSGSGLANRSARPPTAPDDLGMGIFANIVQRIHVVLFASCDQGSRIGRGVCPRKQAQPSPSGIGGIGSVLEAATTLAQAKGRRIQVCPRLQRYSMVTVSACIAGHDDHQQFASVRRAFST